MFRYSRTERIMSLTINSTNKVEGTKQATHNLCSYNVAADPAVDFGNDEVGLDRRTFRY